MGTLIGTYLDLYFVGKGFYSFPKRPLSEIFSVNIGFNLIVLPFFIWIFLLLSKKMTISGKVAIMAGISILVPISEMMAEKWGFFVHSGEWKHTYSLFGYFFYMIFLLGFLAITSWASRKPHE
jgi:hypothetical protein